MYRIAKHQAVKAEAQYRKQQQQHKIISHFGNDGGLGAGKSVIINKPALTLLYKAFGYGVYRGKKQDYPEEGIPGGGVKFTSPSAKAHVTNKNGAAQVQQYAIKGRTLPPFQENFFMNKVNSFVKEFCQKTSF